MTSRTKRRLTVLALALGLIAAAPYVFHAVTVEGARFRFMAVKFRAETIDIGYGPDRTVAVSFGPATFVLLSKPGKSTFVWFLTSLQRSGNVKLPDADITLRVACAVALAGVWLLVLSGRMLARRLTHKNAGAAV